MFCRIRPANPRESEGGKREAVVVSTAEEGEVAVINPARNVRDPMKTFRFNRVFSPAATQGKEDGYPRMCEDVHTHL